MRIYAFDGLRYGDGHADTGRLAAPPYDQIGPERARELHAVDPHHFTWLTRPDEGESGDLYRESARLHQAWLGDGAVVREGRPALYPYAIELAGGGRRLGLTALVELEPPESGNIRAHEETLAKPLADRLALLEATRVDYEPVLLTAEDHGALDRLLARDIDQAKPLASHQDEDGNRHDLYRVDDPDRIARYRELLAGAPSAIADGHHRYKVGLTYARDRQLLGQRTGAAAKLAVITSLDSPGLAILPIHRGLLEVGDLAPAIALASDRQLAAAGSGHTFAEMVAGSAQPAIGVRRAGSAPELWRLDPAAGAAQQNLSEAARQLPVALLHGALLPALGFAESSATDGTVQYRSDPDTLWRQVEAGELAVGFWLPPMEPAQFAAAIAQGDLLPPKSTRFLPKVMSGLVWADHEGRLG